jgi:DNA-binding NtrC family response regulator
MNKTRNSLLVSGRENASSRAKERGQRILVVDDEEVIADTITQILLLRGYVATAAYDGDSALEAAMLLPPQLLLTDVVLPGMNGIELAQTVKRIYPDCKVLLFSGQASTVDLMASAGRAGHRFTLLDKPVPPAQLLALVAEQLHPSAVQSNAAAQ